MGFWNLQVSVDAVLALEEGAYNQPLITLGFWIVLVIVRDKRQKSTENLVMKWFVTESISEAGFDLIMLRTKQEDDKREQNLTDNKRERGLNM